MYHSKGRLDATHTAAVNAEAYSKKNDDAPSDGLTGIVDSLSYRIGSIEKHFHTHERWFRKSADQSGDNWATSLSSAGMGAPYQAISGAADFGSDPDDEAKLLGSDDTPSTSGGVYYDPHRLLIIEQTELTVYYLRLIYGTETMAAAISAGQYTEIAVVSQTKAGGFPVNVMMPRVVVGTKLWLQCKNDTDNATIDFLLGIHEYVG